MNILYRPRSRGFATLDILFAIVLFALMIPVALSFMNRGLEQTQAKAAANHAAVVNEAANSFIQANYGALSVGGNLTTGQAVTGLTIGGAANATANDAVAIPFALLSAGGFISPNFAGQNAFRQTYTLYVLQPAVGNLAGMVVTSGGRGGDPNHPDFDDILIPTTAGMVGVEGGYIPSGRLPGQVATTAIGAFGGWTAPVGGAANNIPNPGSGHLASLLFFEAGALASNHLSRVWTGNVVDNTMETTLFMGPGADLDMGGNDILNAGNITAAGLTLTGDLDMNGNDISNVDQLSTRRLVIGDPALNNGEVILNGQVLGNFGVTGEIQGDYIRDNHGNDLAMITQELGRIDPGSIVPKPACPPAVPNPQLHLSAIWMVGGIDPTNVEALHSVRSWKTDNGPSWTAHMRILTLGGVFQDAALVGFGLLQAQTRCTL